MTAPSAHAQMQDRTAPATYTCSEFIGAGTPASREQAERMVYWAAGYVSARMIDTAAVHVHSWGFEEFSSHVTRALFDLCPGDPGLTIAEAAAAMVRDLAQAGGSKRFGSDDPR